MDFEHQTSSTEPSKIEIGELCRLCGTQSVSTMQDIFDNNKDILEKISFCLPIIILPNESYPQRICDSCNCILDDVFNFIHMSLATDKHFREKGAYIRTLNINSLPIDGPLACDVCKTFFTDMNLFDIHTEEHKSKMEFSFRIPKLLSATACSHDDCRNLRERSQQNTPKVDKCHCGKTSSRCVLMKPKCDPKIFKNKAKKEIIKEVPDSSECDTELLEKTADIKENKVTKKSQKKLYLCTCCDESFSNNKELKIHSIQIHNISTSADWVCKFCNKSMTTKVGLLIHERIHDGSKPYICEWCGNGFRSRANLTQHQVIHTGVRKYSCPRCNKRFSRRSFVETHMRVHTGERPYCCDICGYRFTQIGDMRRHRNKHQTYPGFNSTNVKSETLPS